ncbi:MAG: hypothetical protein U0263_25970 [Polyangiaceae bacterium]
MKTRYSLLLVLMGLVVACGSNDSDSSSQQKDPATQGECQPEGAWLWKSADATGGTPSEDHVILQIAPDAGANQVTVVFSDRLSAEDKCSPAGDAGAPEPITAVGTLDPATCKLTVEYSQSWCDHGENQCETWSFEVALAGTQAQGQATQSGGCMTNTQSSYTITGSKE